MTVDAQGRITAAVNGTSSGYVDPDIGAIQATGGTTIAETYSYYRITGSAALTSGTVIFNAVYVQTARTITGVQWFQVTQGVYTGDTSSKVGLYSYSGGTLTLVASCVDDASLWKVANNTYGSKAFTTPYSAAAGLYFIAVIWHSSATTTAPSLGTYATALQNSAVVSPFLTNSAKLFGSVASLTDLPATQAMLGVTASSSPRWFGIY